MDIEIIGDLNGTVKLQRYMNFAKFIALLDKQELFLCKTSLFEDKLEGGFTAIDEILSDGFASTLDIIVNHTIPTAERQSPEEREEKHRISSGMLKRIEDEPYHTVFGDIPKENFSHQELYEKQKDFVDVCCWHSNERESMAMWKIYGEDDCAVCVITDVDHIKKNIAEKQGYKILIAKIEYLMYEDEHFKHKHMLAQYMHKTDFYSYEREVRIIGYNPSSDINEERKDLGTFINVNVKDLIKEIRISPTAPDWFCELVRSMCNKFSLNVSVNRSTINIRHSYNTGE
ncbi:DUF2971 domain-containing protein [Pectobacterium jejuense]|uniref:DUF2971 domain-containing protein n=1 Tax=Pectobacterium jejuense TaxID=2974022 RepID=UPI00227F112D|nr:DUF2971 domain-containing protein [Pectobacterium jejuense]MCY9850256.1 DUF2971 domain-containing protein [Pectobacterium jejuense]